MANIVLSGIYKEFTSGRETHLAVDGLNLDVANGEFISLVGPSGCGKSTTLRMIAGLESPDRGRIFVDGRDVTAVPPQSRGLSMVFQNYAIFPHMTVRQNIGYGLKIAGMARADQEKRVREVARLVDIENLLDRYPRQLSGGQRQRVAVARAFARNPDIILLDEPLSNLDAKLRDQTRAELKQLHQRVGHTMIYVTHDQLEALTLSDRIAIMNKGVLQQFAAPSVVFQQPANLFVATFIGSPTMNIIPATLLHGEAHTAVHIEGWSASLPRGGSEWLGPTDVSAALVGIRPKDITVHDGHVEGRLPAVVTLMEPTGSDAILHLDADGRALVAQVADRFDFEPGDKVSLDLSLDHLHLFDVDSGLALYHGRAKYGARPARAHAGPTMAQGAA
ncbi:ABC transporter ATP-binding protein [Ancylobacter mangrovi]|uniref:ABC transporter ATP-binding protein n=1 Tax=Ancylobacter mangrovi TaxID=2972472 RepID=A0A9X2T367_9HYPH|nr:ABC transporter ATP-binding protein [Ancylobacter mangrovi]MCS0494631.1 ABC transporter ATP-binding protein [Ancylobacter mangrovi]MCS0502032.1 ABC transporter ATP-binding protein [Ancylobacter mangrovi]